MPSHAKEEVNAFSVSLWWRLIWNTTLLFWISSVKALSMRSPVAQLGKIPQGIEFSLHSYGSRDLIDLAYIRLAQDSSRRHIFSASSHECHTCLEKCWNFIAIWFVSYTITQQKSHPILSQNFRLIIALKVRASTRKHLPNWCGRINE